MGLEIYGPGSGNSAADMRLYIIVHLPELGEKAATSQFIAWIHCIKISQ
jgi:hypothetical protein